MVHEQNEQTIRAREQQADMQRFANGRWFEIPLVASPRDYEAMSDEERAGFIKGILAAIDRSPPVFPPSLQGASMGPGQARDIWGYRAGALELADIAISSCGLKPDQSILDIGCGTGKLASALIYFLSPSGHYDGFDIARESIEWCAAEFTPKYPHFKFTHVAVENEAYASDAAQSARDFSFPYEDGSFDVVVASSVLTHMDLESGLRYFDEVHRVLRIGGKAAITLFLLNANELPALGEISELLGVGGGMFSYRFFRAEEGFCWHCDEAGQPKSIFTAVQKCGDPVAYDPAWIIPALSRRGWKDARTLWGRWRSGGIKSPFQDVLVLTK